MLWLLLLLGLGACKCNAASGGCNTGCGNACGTNTGVSPSGRPCRDRDCDRCRCGRNCTRGSGCLRGCCR